MALSSATGPGLTTTLTDPHGHVTMSAGMCVGPPLVNMNYIASNMGASVAWGVQVPAAAAKRSGGSGCCRPAGRLVCTDQAGECKLLLLLVLLISRALMDDARQQWDSEAVCSSQCVPVSLSSCSAPSCKAAAAIRLEDDWQKMAHPGFHPWTYDHCQQGLLCAARSAKIIIAHRSQALLQVEESLAKQFQQVKAQQVRGALQAWLAPKGLLQATALPQGLRDVALEFSTALVGSALTVAPAQWVVCCQTAGALGCHPQQLLGLRLCKCLSDA